MSWLTNFGLERSRFTLIAILGLLLTGALLYSDFPKREDPEITIRTAKVTALFGGMPPKRFEQLIADPVERKIREIPEVEDIETLLRTGRMTISVSLKDSVFDLNPVWQELRDKMEEVARELPDGVSGPFVNTGFGDVTIASIAVTGEGFSYRDMEIQAEELQRVLYTVPGVSKVDLYGVQKERIWLEIDAERIASIGIQISTLVDDLQKQNIILPAGSLNAGGSSILLEASGDFESIADIENLLTKVDGVDDFVRLADLITVRRGVVSPKEKPATYNGRPTIVVGVQMQSGYDIEAIGRDIAATVKAIEQTLPIGYELNFGTFQPQKVSRAVNDAVTNVSQTFAFVLLIVLIFLGVRSGLVIASIVPFAIMFALIGMRLLGISLEQVSIAAIIISLGLLVDNGVVIVEDIQRQVREGIDRTQAAKRSGRQFALPLLVSSLTTIFAFMPFFLLEGAQGEYAFSLGAVVAITLMGSWISAMYFLPFIASRALPASEGSDSSGETQTGPWRERYGAFLSMAAKAPVLVIAISYGTVVISSYLFGFARSEMFPLSDRDQVLIYAEMPSGTHIRATERTITAISSWLNNREANPEIKNHIAYVGDGGPRFYLALNPAETAPKNGFILINAKDFEGAMTVAARAKKYLFENHPEARFKVKRLSMGPQESGTVEVELAGPDADRLLALAAETEDAFRGSPMLSQLEDDWGTKILKTVIDIDQDKARRIGLTSEAMSQLLNAYFDGYQISTYRESDQSIPIVVRAAEKSRDSIEDLNNISVAGAGEILSLEQVATFRPSLEFAQIRRLNQVRTIKVVAKSDTLTAGELLTHARAKLDALDLSGGYQMSIGGETADSSEINGKLAAGFPIAIVMMLLAIVFQFNSLRRAAIVFMTIPLVIIGVPIGLILLSEPMSFFGTLGLISLAGIIINNSIVLIDQMDIDCKSMPLLEGIASAAQKRLRPILLTSLTTIVGLMPLYFFGGALWAPLAVVMMFGLGLASIFTLFFVPAAYALFFSREKAPA
jgi:multidrug efflux pump subunit AcrB